MESLIFWIFSFQRQGKRHCKLFGHFKFVNFPTACHIVHSIRYERFFIVLDEADPENISFFEIPPNYLFSVEHIITMVEDNCRFYIISILA